MDAFSSVKLPNYQEANRAFWRQTVIPLVARIQKSSPPGWPPPMAPSPSTMTWIAWMR